MIRCKKCRFRYDGSLRRCPACIGKTPYRYRALIISAVALLIMLVVWYLVANLAQSHDIGR